MADNIKVTPSTDVLAVDVSTQEVGSTHYPNFQQVIIENGVATPVNLSNPIPVSGFPLTAFGDLRTTELSPVFNASFEYTVDNTTLNVNTLVNGGTVTQAEAMAVMTTSTTTGSSALFQSKQHGKYRPGQGGLERFTALFTSSVSGTEQLIGLADEQGGSQAFKNGYIVGYLGSVFGFHRFVNDTVITVAQANWDDPMDGTGASGMTLDQTKLNVFEIQFQYLGAGAITLLIEDDSTGEFVKAHTVLYANKNITPSVFNPNFHHTMWVDNGVTTSNMIVKSSSYGFFVEGKTDLINTHQPQFGTGSREKTSVTTAVPIFTIRNKTIYVSKDNSIDIVLERFSASIEAGSPNNLGELFVIKNGTLGGSPSFSDINTANSVIEIDESATSISGGQTLFGAALAGKNDKESDNIIDLKIILNPGDTLSFVGASANSATIDAATLWKELF